MNSAQQRRASIAVDLGAESCRVSLLRWLGETPHITLVHRFANSPEMSGNEFRWPLDRIVAGVEDGIRRCAPLAPEGVRSLAVDGWAVDYVRLDPHGNAPAAPFCYRDERTLAAETSLHRLIGRDRLRELTGIQISRINTLYQLYADRLAGLPQRPWLNLPEYLLHRWGAPPVAEYTNATHSQLIDLTTRTWSPEIFAAAGLDLAFAPRLVPPGSRLGKLSGPLAELPALRDVDLIAPACHDTASAIAGIAATSDDWAYISSGTWSLVGTLLPAAVNSPSAREDNFTNLGAVGGLTCFHKNVNGMWLLKQCMDAWNEQTPTWELPGLLAAAEALPTPRHLLEVDDPELLLMGAMPQRINAQLRSRDLPSLDESSAAAPAMIALILHSLAARYADVLARVQQHTGKSLHRIYIVGGGNRNTLLNRLTAAATGMEVLTGSAESSTLGNFAVQLAAPSTTHPAASEAFRSEVAAWAATLG